MNAVAKQERHSSDIGSAGNPLKSRKQSSAYIGVIPVMNVLANVERDRKRAKKERWCSNPMLRF